MLRRQPASNPRGFVPDYGQGLRAREEQNGVDGGKEWLKHIKLHKYWPMFSHWSYDEFMSLTQENIEDKIAEIGAEGMTEGAKKRLLQCIAELREREEILLTLTQNAISGKFQYKNLHDMLYLSKTPFPSKPASDLSKGFITAVYEVYNYLRKRNAPYWTRNVMSLILKNIEERQVLRDTTKIMFMNMAVKQYVKASNEDPGYNYHNCESVLPITNKWDDKDTFQKRSTCSPLKEEQKCLKNLSRSLTVSPRAAKINLLNPSSPEGNLNVLSQSPGAQALPVINQTFQIPFERTKTLFKSDSTHYNQNLVNSNSTSSQRDTDQLKLNPSPQRFEYEEECNSKIRKNLNPFHRNRKIPQYLNTNGESWKKQNVTQKQFPNYKRDNIWNFLPEEFIHLNMNEDLNNSYPPNPNTIEKYLPLTACAQDSSWLPNADIHPRRKVNFQRKNVSRCSNQSDFPFTNKVYHQPRFTRIYKSNPNQHQRHSEILNERPREVQNQAYPRSWQSHVNLQNDLQEMCWVPCFLNRPLHGINHLNSQVLQNLNSNGMYWLSETFEGMNLSSNNVARHHWNLS